MTATPTLLDRGLELARVDLAPTHRQPSARAVAIATVVAVLGSLIADAILVAIGTAMFPATKGYPHFLFPDYAKLTIIGVVGSCFAWPVITRVTSAPRWLFFRLAILVSAVLLLPDVWLLAKSQPTSAVAVLVVMHFAIAVVTYNALVHLAPVGWERHRAE